MTLRFSLRTLLVVTTIAVALCVWRDSPRRNANRFVEALEAGKYEEADAMIVDPEGRDIVVFIKGDDRNRIEARRLRQSPGDWLNGTCYVALKSEDFRGLGCAIASRVAFTSNGAEEFSIASLTGIVDYTPDPQMIRKDITD